MNVTASASGIDFRAIWQLLLRRRWVILTATLVLFGAVVLHTLRQPKIYGATTSIVIRTSWIDSRDEIVVTGTSSSSAAVDVPAVAKIGQLHFFAAFDTPET